MNLFKLVGSVFINNNDANKTIDGTIEKAKELSTKVGKSMQDTGSKMTDLGKKIAPVSLAFAGMVTASVKSASDFQNGMAKMSTLFDTTKISVDDLSKKFLDLSNKTGISATELAEAGYQALSAGVDVRDSAKFVETAGQLAKAGFTSTTTSVDVLTTAMNAYGKSAGTAEQIANKLVRTQNLGKTTVDELGSSMGKIIPTASGMNVSINNLMAGYVSLTKQGIATAEATTYMNSMLNELGDSGTTVGKILKDVTGKSFQELMADGASMGDVLKILQDEADASGTNFNELWGSAEAGKASLALLNGGVDEFNATVETMASNTDDVGDALNKLETPSVKAKKALNQIKNSGIELGTAFLGAVSPVIDKVASGVEKLTSWFNNLPTPIKTVIATTMLIIGALSPILIIGGKILVLVGNVMNILPTITPVITAVKTAVSGLFTTLLTNPIGLIVTGIVALVAGFMHLWHTSESFRNFWIGLWEGIKSAVSTAWEAVKSAVSAGITQIGVVINTAKATILAPFEAVWNGCKTVVTTVWNAISTIISTVIGVISTIISTKWMLISSIISSVMDGIRSIVSNVWNSISSAISGVLESIKTTISTAWNTVKDSISTILGTIKTTVSTIWFNIKTAIYNTVIKIVSDVKGAFDKVKSNVVTPITEAKTKALQIFDNIKSGIKQKIDGAKDAVKGAVNKMKSFFDFEWKLPHIKLPHISISGKFSLNPPSVPKFSIAWYKKAMDSPYLFTKPTVFSTPSGLKGAGEAGDEIMYGRNRLMNDIGEAVGSRSGKTESILEMILSVLREILEKDSDIYMDGKKLTQEINKNLGLEW